MNDYVNRVISSSNTFNNLFFNKDVNGNHSNFVLRSDVEEKLQMYYKNIYNVFSSTSYDYLFNDNYVGRFISSKTTEVNNTFGRLAYLIIKDKTIYAEAYSSVDTSTQIAEFNYWIIVESISDPEDEVNVVILNFINTTKIILNMYNTLNSMLEEKTNTYEEQYKYLNGTEGLDPDDPDYVEKLVLVSKADAQAKLDNIDYTERELIDYNKQFFKPVSFQITPGDSTGRPLLDYEQAQEDVLYFCYYHDDNVTNGEDDNYKEWYIPISIDPQTQEIIKHDWEEVGNESETKIDDTELNQRIADSTLEYTLLENRYKGDYNPIYSDFKNHLISDFSIEPVVIPYSNIINPYYVSTKYVITQVLGDNQETALTTYVYDGAKGVKGPKGFIGDSSYDSYIRLYEHMIEFQNDTISYGNDVPSYNKFDPSSGSVITGHKYYIDFDKLSYIDGYSVTGFNIVDNQDNTVTITETLATNVVNSDPNINLNNTVTKTFSNVRVKGEKGSTGANGDDGYVITSASVIIDANNYVTLSQQESNGTSIDVPIIQYKSKTIQSISTPSRNLVTITTTSGDTIQKYIPTYDYSLLTNFTLGINSNTSKSCLIQEKDARYQQKIDMTDYVMVYPIYGNVDVVSGVLTIKYNDGTIQTINNSDVIKNYYDADYAISFNNNIITQTVTKTYQNGTTSTSTETFNLSEGVNLNKEVVRFYSDSNIIYLELSDSTVIPIVDYSNLVTTPSSGSSIDGNIYTYSVTSGLNGAQILHQVSTSNPSATADFTFSYPSVISVEISSIVNDNTTTITQTYSNGESDTYQYLSTELWNSIQAPSYTFSYNTDTSVLSYVYYDPLIHQPSEPIVVNNIPNNKTYVDHDILDIGYNSELDKLYLLYTSYTNPSDVEEVDCNNFNLDHTSFTYTINNPFTYLYSDYYSFNIPYYITTSEYSTVIHNLNSQILVMSVENAQPQLFSFGGGIGIVFAKYRTETVTEPTTINVDNTENNKTLIQIGNGGSLTLDKQGQDDKYVVRFNGVFVEMIKVDNTQTLTEQDKGVYMLRDY